LLPLLHPDHFDEFLDAADDVLSAVSSSASIHSVGVGLVAYETVSRDKDRIVFMLLLRSHAHAG